MTNSNLLNMSWGEKAVMLVTLLLMLIKLTVDPTMSWWFVFMPLIVMVGGFILILAFFVLICKLFLTPPFKEK